MSAIFNYDNKFFSAFNKVINIFCLGLFFLFSSIPIFTIGAASTALYYTVNKVIRHGRSYVWQEYWSSFKSNFKQSTVIGLCFLAFAALMGVDLYIMKIMVQVESTLAQAWIIFAIMLVLELLVWFYVYPNIARFENTNKAIVKNAAIMAVANLPQTIIMLVIFVALLIALYYMPIYIMPLMICFFPGTFVWLQSFVMEKILRKYMSEEDIAAEDERNREYYN